MKTKNEESLNETQFLNALRDATEKFNFDEWYELNEENINIELAENGADREMDFNPELEFENRYQKYLET